MTVSSRCGILCEECTYLKNGQCAGGCANICKPFWGDSCPVKSCCEGRMLLHCGQCWEFPCDLLKKFAYDEKQGDNGKRIGQCLKWREENQREIIGEAIKLLEQCTDLAVSSVTPEGYPRTCIVSKLGADGLKEIYFSTGTNSRKTTDFRRDPKASLCYYHKGDSITLLGEIEIIQDRAAKEAVWSDWMQQHFPGGIDDPEYCLMKFVPREMTFWITQRFGTFPLNQG